MNQNIYKTLFYQNLNSYILIKLKAKKAIKTFKMSQNSVPNVVSEEVYTQQDMQNAANNQVMQVFGDDYQEPIGEDGIQEFEDEHSAEAAMDGNTLIDEMTGNFELFK